jgi:hypothetical protein
MVEEWVRVWASATETATLQQTAAASGSATETATVQQTAESTVLHCPSTKSRLTRSLRRWLRELQRMQRRSDKR